MFFRIIISKIIRPLGLIIFAAGLYLGLYFINQSNIVQGLLISILMLGAEILGLTLALSDWAEDIFCKEKKSFDKCKECKHWKAKIVKRLNSYPLYIYEMDLGHCGFIEDYFKKK